MLSEGVYHQLTWSGLTLATVPADRYTFTGWSGPGYSSGMTTTDSLNFAEGELTVYEDSPFSNIPIIGPIIDWIEAQLNALYNWLVSQFWAIVIPIRDAVSAVLGVLISPITTAVGWVQGKLLDVWHWLSSAIPSAIEAIKVKVLDVWHWVTTAIPNALDWIRDRVGSLLSRVGDIIPAITNAADNIIKSIARVFSLFFDPICVQVNAIFKSSRSVLEGSLSYNSPEIRAQVLSWWPKGTVLSDYISIAVKFIFSLPKIIKDLLGGGFAIIFGENPEGWGQRVDARLAKVTDTTESLPQFIKTDVAEPILNGVKTLFEKLAGILKAAFDLIWDAIVKFFTVILPGWFKGLWEAIHGALSWVWDKVTDIANFFLDEVLKLVGIHSPITPEGGLGTLKGMVKVGLGLAGGLGLMTLAGNLVHPLHSLGLEHISAMVYDMTNYKILIGAGMGVIAACSIRIPLTQHFNSILRPNIPSERAASEMYNRELISYDAYSEFLALRGYPNKWHQNIAALTETPLRYFGLAAIARSGYYDPDFFNKDLIRGGYPPESRQLLLNMFAQASSESVKGLMSGIAVKRFKEGMTTESQYRSELTILGYTDQQFPQYLAAAQMEFAYDYITDLISAYRDAAAKGQISLDDFRARLVSLGVVPARVEAYVLRVRARLDPAGPLKPVGPPKAEYETDAGKLKVDTLRRKRQSQIITRDVEGAGLLTLGMPVEYVTAIVDNDDARLAAEVTAKVGPPKALYETDAGKIQVDTIRRARRKELITRDQEVTAFKDLEMPAEYAAAIADNDDARLAEKASAE
jgi:hypothetical protein